MVSEDTSPVDSPLTWVDVSAAMTAVDSPPICSEVRLAICAAISPELSPAAAALEIAANWVAAEPVHRQAVQRRHLG